MPQIRQADPADYESLLRFLAEAYGVSSGFFPGRYPSWWGEYTDFSRIWVMAREDRIESLVRIFPLELVLGKVKISVAGIGNVATLPAARGQGHMHHLMYRVIEEMKKDFSLSMLWGDRHRYRLFGYEQAGSCLRMTISACGLTKMGVKPLAARRYFGETALLEQIRRCYVRQPFRRARDEREDALIYGKADLIVWTGGENGHFGYLAFSSDERSDFGVLEFGGHPMTVLGLAAERFGAGGILSLSFTFPVRDAAAPEFLEAASNWSIEPAGLVKILHLSTAIKLFRPWLTENRDAADPRLLHLPEAETVERLFGVGRPGAAPLFCGPLDRV